ncbi:hypothetical protein L195_g034170 [Trifolium pratense]|uniref:Uncharacterized protein n=1 Tax=Trifolium pratense TaxID=57577 RepID=A0A2K3LI27_TRIPR|nr:hypothetical protein L195_g034170 [Trifolium pratense]
MLIKFPSKLVGGRRGSSWWREVASIRDGGVDFKCQVHALGWEPNIADQWILKHHVGGGYSVKSALPTRDNLVRCNTIHHGSQLCVTGCGGMEPIFAPLWGLVRSWINTSSADPNLLRDHLLQFSYLA